MRSFVFLFFTLCLIGTSAGVASASEWPHAREGWMVGFDIGVGSAEAKIDADDGSYDAVSDRSGGGAGGLRFGYAVTPNLVLGFEGSAWVHQEEVDGFGGSVDVKTTLSAATLGLTWFPTDEGFFLRAGLGGSQAKIEVDFGSVTSEVSENGGALLLGAGYEFRVTRTFSIGPQLTFFVAGFGDVDVDDGSGGTVNADLTANVASGSLLMNWYF